MRQRGAPAGPARGLVGDAPAAATVCRRCESRALPVRLSLGPKPALAGLLAPDPSCGQRRLRRGVRASGEAQVPMIGRAAADGPSASRLGRLPAWVGRPVKARLRAGLSCEACCSPALVVAVATSKAQPNVLSLEDSPAIHHHHQDGRLRPLVDPDDAPGTGTEPIAAVYASGQEPPGSPGPLRPAGPAGGQKVT